MGRIDEAWKRYSHVTSGPAVAPTPGPQVRSSALSQYPLERPAVERPEPVVAKPLFLTPDVHPETAPRAVEPPPHPVTPTAVTPPRHPAAAASVPPPPVMMPVPTATMVHPVTVAAAVASPPAALAADLSDPSARIVAALHEAHASSGLRAAMVTGAGTAEDNTLVAATLARALSDMLPRVLLIDIAGSPTLETCIGARLDADGSDRSHTRWQSLPISEVTPHLSVATAERLAPPRGFTSERLGAVLENCSIFDFVVICAPPVPALPDPAQLARYAGAVVFVLSARAPFSANERAMTQVGRATIVGTVLSGVPGDQPDTPLTTGTSAPVSNTREPAPPRIG